MNDSKLNIFILVALNLAVMIMSGIFSYIHLSEWYKVGIQNKIEGYNFSTTANGPYFYKSPRIYSVMLLTFGILFLIPIITAIFALIKKNKFLSLVTFITTVLLLIIATIQQYII